MKTLNRFYKYVPYIYFITVFIYWFSNANKSNGIRAFPILLLTVPVIWQIFRPDRQINLMLGISFVSISSYLILAYLSDLFGIISLIDATMLLMAYVGVFVLTNFVMSLWILRNSFKHTS